MRRLYQKEWHNIPFESFAVLSSSHLADAHFYDRFYDVFFKKYASQAELDPEWLTLKLQVAEFLEKHPGFTKESRILSVGCGLGVIEKDLIEKGYRRLEVTEVSDKPLRWLLPVLDAGAIHTGLFPGCLPDNRCYDFALLASVEYFFDEQELTGFLKGVMSRLNQGACLIMSWSFEHDRILPRLSAGIKDIVGLLLEKTGVYRRGQFWGYIRTPNEFRETMKRAGFVDVQDGVLEMKTKWGTYWISGRTPIPGEMAG